MPGTDHAAVPAPVGVGVLTVLALVVSVVLLTHWERGFEHDPQLRAHAGLITATSDISLVRPANFARAMKTIRSQVPAESAVRILTVTPSQVRATLLLPSGTESVVTIAPGVGPDVRKTGNRYSSRTGIALGAILSTAPERIVERAQRRFQLRPSELDRLDLTPTGTESGTWVGRWKQPRDASDVSADIRGHHVKRYGFA